MIFEKEMKLFKEFFDDGYSIRLSVQKAGLSKYIRLYPKQVKEHPIYKERKLIYEDRLRNKAHSFDTGYLKMIGAEIKEEKKSEPESSLVLTLPSSTPTILPRGVR